jgi:hypothetical protein
MHLSNYGRGYTLDSRVISPKHDTKEFTDVPDIESIATISEDKESLTIFAVNRNMEEDILFDKFCSEGGYYEVPEFMCPICNFIEYSEYDLSAYLLKEYGVSRDEVFAEVKQLNKRRRKLYENEYITYVCKKFDLNPTEIMAGWKEKFGTYHNFKASLR